MEYSKGEEIAEPLRKHQLQEPMSSPERDFPRLQERFVEYPRILGVDHDSARGDLAGMRRR